MTIHVPGKLGLTMSCSHIRYSGNAVIGNHGNGNRRHEQGHGNDAERLRPHHRPDFYRLPDHPLVLQTYVWQDYDLAPDFPEMHGFLKFWQEKLDGPLHSVRYVHRQVISAQEWRALKGEFILH